MPYASIRLDLSRQRRNRFGSDFVRRCSACLTNLTNKRGRRHHQAMPRVLNLYEAKSQLSALVEEAVAGHEIVIAKAGVPRARLVPLRRGARRRPGGSKGRIRIARDFDAPFPPEILAAFRGKNR